MHQKSIFDVMIKDSTNFLTTHPNNRLPLYSFLFCNNMKMRKNKKFLATSWYEGNLNNVNVVYCNEQTWLRIAFSAPKFCNLVECSRQLQWQKDWVYHKSPMDLARNYLAAQQQFWLPFSREIEKYIIGFLSQVNAAHNTIKIRTLISLKICHDIIELE